MERPERVEHGEATPTPADRRAGPDRRRRPTPIFSRYSLFGGRRTGARRRGEEAGSFVDRYGLRVGVVVLAIVALNLADAWFTLYFLSHGGEELNPFVQSILDLGSHPYPFLLFKGADDEPYRSLYLWIDVEGPS